MANPKICPCTPFPDCRVRILITNRDRITLPQKHENVNASRNSLARQAFRLIRSVSRISLLFLFPEKSIYSPFICLFLFLPRIEPTLNYYTTLSLRVVPFVVSMLPALFFFPNLFFFFFLFFHAQLEWNLRAFTLVRF